MSYKSYNNQQEPLNKNPLNQSKLDKMEKPKNQKKTKKTSPKFEICGSVRFFWVATPPPLNCFNCAISTLTVRYPVMKILFCISLVNSCFKRTDCKIRYGYNAVGLILETVGNGRVKDLTVIYIFLTRCVNRQALSPSVYVIRQRWHVPLLRAGTLVTSSVCMSLDNDGTYHYY